MGLKTEELQVVLGELERLLTRHGEDHWAAWIARSARGIRAGESFGVQRLLRAYGGMGSFNDLYLHPLNGHGLTDAEVIATNERLDRLRTMAWRLAHEVRRDADGE